MAITNAVKTLKDYFSTPERPLETKEIIALRKHDESAVQALAEGIQNGTLDYDV